MRGLVENDLIRRFLRQSLCVVLFLIVTVNIHAVVYTHDQCNFGTASASSSWSASYGANYAFDDVVNELNGWFTANSITSGWLQYSFTSAKCIKKYCIKLRGYSTADDSAPKDWTFEASDDGSNWTILDIRTNETGWSAYEERSYEFSSTNSYLYYRINITANNGHTFTGIAEMEMYEEAVYIGNGGHESVWYFGFGASLDFRYDPPLAGTQSVMSQWEGCSSISDINGDILFYTNGVSVWDATNTLMPNGTGLFGSFSSTQSSLVVPHPTDSDIYFIFTLYRNGDYEIGHKGLCYSVVDMSLNGGLGDIISGQKNIELNNPNTEKITAVKHSNGVDIWVLTHDWGNNNFLAYQISSSGINATPVTSSAGIVHYDNFNGWYSAGYMKVSPDGSRIALNVLGAQTTQLFDFDSGTGIVSNPMTLSTTRHQAYGIEFSPDGTKLYTTAWEHNNILQYDLSLGTEAAIAASEIEIAVSAVTGGSNYSGLGALQVAPDGNIYVSKDANGIGGNVNGLNGWLGIITSPNEAFDGSKSDPVYVDNGVYLGGKASGIGLPTYIQTYFKPLPVILMAFNANCENGVARIFWKTASEKNNDYFILEKLTSKTDFVEIARIEGAGNSNKVIKYTFADENIASYDNYYRLKQVDYDGKITVYNMISLKCGDVYQNEPLMSVYPNPFISEFKLNIDNISENKIEILIYDEIGILVFHESYEISEKSFETTIKLSGLESAVYTIKCAINGIVLSSKVIRK